MLWHITTEEEWTAAQTRGQYVVDSLTRLGFIHLSTDRQWLKVANTWFADVHAPLVLLGIDPERLAAEVRFEPADGDHFPHLYGALNLDAVVQVLALPRSAGGGYAVPEALVIR